MLTVTAHAWGAGGAYPWFPFFPLVFPLVFPLFWLGFFLLGRRLWWRRTWADDLGHRRDSAESVLAHRFAEGKIDDQEYTSRLAVLRGRPSTSSGPQDMPR
jgi:uncharacterized membrane protein